MITPDAETLMMTAEEAGKRLDKVLAERYPDAHSRAYLQWLIEENHVLLNHKPVKKRVKVAAGDRVDVCFVLTPEIELKPEKIFLDIIYEDEAIIVVNKSAGLVVHPGAGNWTGTFVNGLLYHCKKLPEGETLRPGIVHRLDKETTGLLVAAKTAEAQHKLVELFSSRRVYKEYIAVCVGNPGKGTVDAPIARHPVHRQKMAVVEGGRRSVTHYETLKYDVSLSLVKLVLETGRTHQIRVHMKQIGFPVLGDPVYGSSAMNQKFQLGRQMLHAAKLIFPHPVTGKEMVLEAPVPDEMAKVMARLSCLSGFQ